MPDRRMFTKKITESDAFLDMPSSTQMLYFHLSMNADDDGFVNNPRKIQRMCGASDDDFKLLLMKSFVISFDSGVIVIKHWRMHNYIQSDRYKPTAYIEEKSMLSLKKNKAYTLDKNTSTIKKESFPVSNTTKKEENLDAIKKIVDYLNEKCNTNYRYNTQNTRKHINARLSEGYTLSDFINVIDKKSQEWIGTDWQKFLRPDTLFSSKFESYLNQKIVVNDAEKLLNDWRNS